ncbi:NAD-dependent protein deacylase [Sedimentibacter sp. zth1]|uniref:NAD-dependent protein deacylase n=1 Tax=Sedimentibacter sp. zth1 TaxID=2816908 RepID=UPI001A9317DC|nr:NAD-dependent protein deacylase [Sedimentibacter sp. zth1]QSX05311.1 NAD-dependent protein deacylase [Sedimentibacter sp. zth1]
MDDLIFNLKSILKNSKNLVFFGGAGVSTESNIPDFRSKNGLYNAVSKYGFPPEEILSRTFFEKHTNIFYKYYRENMLNLDALPNKAHEALAKLEHMGILKAIITQNIDGLHQLAGSTNVIELHGSVHRNYCRRCSKFFEAAHVKNTTNIPTCDDCGGIIKPDVVLYEESLNFENIDSAIKYIENADTLIIGGTSLAVYPAASFINYFRGNTLVLINKSSTPYDKLADLVINGAIGDVLSKATNFEVE